MIQTDALTKQLGGRTIVSDVTFRCEPGTVTGFLGPNGAGKTTTMRMITGVLPPSSGAAKVAGYDVFEQSLQVRRRIGYLPENPAPYEYLTGRPT